METVLLNAPDGISARLGSDAHAEDHDRKRELAREIVAARLHVREDDVRVERESPAQFGYHTRLVARVAGAVVPLAITSAAAGSSTVVVVADSVVPLGIDLRSARPSDDELEQMRQHSHLFPGVSRDALLTHWTRVQAVRHADGRARIRPEEVMIDPALVRGWVPDRRVHYQLADLSHSRWTVTLAYGALPV